MDTTQLVRQHTSIEYTPLSRGYIARVVEFVAGKSKQKAAVTAYTDQLLVILPGASSEHLYGPCRWGAIHGKTFPAVGAACQVGVDETNHPVVLWWEGEYENPTPEKPQAWKRISTGLGYKNSWVDEELTFEPGEYRKDPFGNVQLRGVIKGGESGKTAFTLLAALRPTKQEEFVVIASLRAPAEILITTAGAVIPSNSASSEVKGYVGLSGVNFSTE